MRGLLIIFEGPNFVGKTTIINSYLNKFNINNNYKIYKFPNRTTQTGLIIDDYLKKKKVFESLDQRIEIFAQNRKEQLENIMNDLNNGINVICDRYIFSGITYPLYDLYTEHDNGIINLHDMDSKNYNYIDFLIKKWLSFDKGMPKPDMVFIINSEFNRNENERFQKYDKDKLCNIFFSLCKITNTNYEFIFNDIDQLNIICNGINTYLNNLSINTNSIEYY